MNRVLFRVDGNSTIGMGHIVRCISIAKELMCSNVDVLFAVSKDSNIGKFVDNEIKFLFMDSVYDDWKEENEICCISRYKPDLIIVDSYYVRNDYFTLLRNKYKTLYIDDLVRNDILVDYIVNFNIEADVKEYKNNNKLYIGSKYYPFPKTFTSYKNKIIKDSVNNVLVTSGSTDSYHSVLKILNTLSEAYPNINFNYIVGLYYEESYKNELKSIKKPNVNLIEWGNDTIKNYLQNDIVICSGSSTLYEAIALGVPSLSFEFVDNHHAECLGFSKYKIAPFLGKVYEKDFISNLLTNFKRELIYDVRKIQIENSKLYISKYGLFNLKKIILDIISEE